MTRFVPDTLFARTLVGFGSLVALVLVGAVVVAVVSSFDLDPESELALWLVGLVLLVPVVLIAAGLALTDLLFLWGSGAPERDA